MRAYLMLVFVVTCSATIADPQAGIAQDPPNDARKVQIWSGRSLTSDRGLSPGSPETETSPRVAKPLSQDPSYQQQTRFLLCEPDDSDATEPTPSADASVAERHAESVR